MAARNFSSWVQIVVDGEVAGREQLMSGVYGVAPVKPMTSNQTELPRLLGADVGGGSALVEDTNDGSKVSMFTGLFTGKHTLDEAEEEDTVASEVESISREWLTSFWTAYDNAALGVTGARSSTLTDKRPFTSLYRAVVTADSDAGYTASANHTFTGSAGVTYDTLSTGLGKIENTRFWSPEAMVAFAHPGFREAMRGIKDEHGHPIFKEQITVPRLLLGGGGTVGENVIVDAVFGIPIVWTYGAIKSNHYGMTAVGDRFIAFVNSRYLTRGDRIPPQARFIPASINTDALEHTVQQRARQGFALRVPQAASVVEDDS